MLIYFMPQLQNILSIGITEIYTILYRPPIMVVQIFEIFVSIYSLYVSFIGLCLRKGLNKEVQQSIFRRQVLFVIIRVISTTPFTIYAAEELFY